MCCPQGERQRPGFGSETGLLFCFKERVLIDSLRAMWLGLFLTFVSWYQVFAETEGAERGTSSEALLWEAVERSGLAEHYQYYLDKFPQGVCAEVAEGRLSEAEAWEEVLSLNTQMALESYLQTELVAKFGDAGFERARTLLSYFKSNIGHNGPAPFSVARLLQKVDRFRAEQAPAKRCGIKSFVVQNSLEADLWSEAEN